MLSEVVLVARENLENTMYTDTCNIIEHTKSKVDGVTTFVDSAVATNEPCRISASSLKANEQSISSAEIGQSIKLFISPDATVNEGSKVVVTREGKTLQYMASGKPMIYPTHQEIMLIPFERWA